MSKGFPVGDGILENYEVVVVGGGSAGLSAGLVLARSRRSVLVVDAGEQRNLHAAGVHGLLGNDGISPAKLIERGRAEVRHYGGRLTSGEVSKVKRDGDKFIVGLRNGRSIGALKMLVATGLVDELPEVPGLRERWGRDVIHCPYCQGWEVRDQAIGVLANTPMSPHQALMFRQFSRDVIYFSNNTLLSDDDAELLAARGIKIVDGEVTALEVARDRLAGLKLIGGSVIKLEVVVVSARLMARTDFLAGLGLRIAQHPSGLGEHIPTDQDGRTDIPGVWAAGNVTDLNAQVGPSIAAGALVASKINAKLIDEAAREAVKRNNPRKYR